MTYASDLTLLDTVLLGTALAWADGSVAGASLDHAMWFHRPFRADQWLLYAQESPVAAGGRGLARGQVFTADGRTRGLRRAGGPHPHPRRSATRPQRHPARKPSFRGTRDRIARSKMCCPAVGALRRLCVMSVGQSN